MYHLNILFENLSTPRLAFHLTRQMFS